MSHLEKIKPVRIGISGCGGITPTVIRSIIGFDELDIVAVQDVDSDAASRVADEFHIPRCFTEFSDLLAQDIEMAVINTPNDLHLPMALDAFASGKHCLIQKPLARSIEEGEQIVKAARNAGKLLGVVMLERSDPVYRQMRSMVDAGCFGRIIVFRAALAHVNHLKNPPAPGTWRSSPERIGGGSFIQLAIHHLDLAQFLLNQEIVEVTALSTSMIEPEMFPKDETTAAVVRFSGGTVGQFISSFTTTMDSIEIFGTDGMIQRDDGGIRWSSKELFSGDVWESQRVEEIHELSMPWLADRIIALHPLYEPHRLFAHAIRGKAPVETRGEDGLRALKIVEAVQKSTETRQTIVVE